MSENVWTPDDNEIMKEEMPGIVEMAKVVDPEYPEVTIPDAPTMAFMPPHAFDLDKLKTFLQPHIVQIEALAERATGLKVVDAETNVTAVEMAGQLTKLGKSIDGTRKELIDPYGTVVNGVNGAARPIKALLDKTVKTLKGKIGAYGAEQAEVNRRIAMKVAEEEAAIRKKELEAERQTEIARQVVEREEALARQKELDAKAKEASVESVEVAIPEVVDPGVPDPVIVVPKDVAGGPTRTAEGTTFTVKTWKHRLISLDQVPRKFTVMSLDDKAVKDAIDAGVRTIPGLEIYEHSDVRLRTK